MQSRYCAALLFAAAAVTAAGQARPRITGISHLAVYTSDAAATEHYYTVSGNLGTIDVKTGQEVAPGERIGSVGDDGSGAALYFEVRRGTQAVAPGPWLGL